MKNLFYIILIAMLIYACNNTYAQTAGTADLSYNTGQTGFDSYLNKIVELSSGKLLAGGDFTSFNSIDVPDYLIRLNADGSHDNTFNNGGSGFNSRVQDIAVLSDGKILVAGQFTTYNGVNCPDDLVRLNSDGSIDGTFNSGGSGFNNSLMSIGVQSDGKIVCGGYFTQFNGSDCSDCICRLNSDGTIDATFNSGGSGLNYSSSPNVRNLKISSDDKVLVAGWFTQYNGSECPDYFIRLNSNGSLDGTFNSGGAGLNSAAATIDIDSDGKILVGGVFNTYNGSNCRGAIARINADGTLDNTFTMNGNNGMIRRVKITSDGKILIGGSFTQINGWNVPISFMRLNSDGTNDDTFNTGGTGYNGYVTNIIQLSTGKILVGGDFTQYNSTDCPARLMRLYNPLPPMLQSTLVGNILTGSAAGTGYITSTSDIAVTARGFCWNTTGTPTTSNSKVEEMGTFTIGSFTGSITGLSAGTTYYVRAYATNTIGTGYGNQVSFTTIPTLPEWGLIAMISLIAVAGGWFVWRKIV